jgi:hypothetical protein
MASRGALPDTEEIIMHRALPIAVLCISLFAPPAAQAASHREAPLTSLDRTADITDFYAFVSPERPDTAASIVCTDPLLEPANGPNYFPFDPDIEYAIRVDNDHDARADVVFEVRFRTEQNLPGVPVGLAGAGDGIAAPALSPAPIAPGTKLVPPAITALEGPGSQGIGLRQTYEVVMRRGKQRIPLRRAGGGNLVALPSNVGPRTMPDYASLFAQAVYELPFGIRVFAGTVDDAFFIDLGAAFDTLNFRVIPGPGSTGVPLVLSDAQDASDDANFLADDVSGYNVNCIAIEVPIRKLTAHGNLPTPQDPLRQVGFWGTTSRRAFNIRQDEKPAIDLGSFVQVQRMANPLFNELLIGTDQKDRWSRARPADDAAFADSALDPLIVRLGQAAFAAAGIEFAIPQPPRLDLAPLVFYASGAGGPFADLLRVDLSVAPTPAADRSRLGGCGGDPAGFPNGRRTTDDVTDCFLRAGFGILIPEFNVFPFNRLGDGVNVNDNPVPETFPYLAPANSGRNSRHVDPGEVGCATADGNCPVF